MPALDGLRALAVIAVIAYHVGFAWAPGGLLGVGVFFTLSGYLITDLLLAAKRSGRLRLGEFWLARARRLLPALYLMLAVVVLWLAVGPHDGVFDVRGPVGSAVLYVNNWWQISQHLSYFARFGPPSPLSHLWSLAVEEQFYLVWPFLLLLGVRLIPERSRPIAIRPRLAGATLALAVASAVEMALLYHPSFDNSRLYFGTDTRAFGLLFGAALAMVWPSRSLTGQGAASARVILDALGIVGLVAIVLLVWRTDQYSAFLYRGGMVALSVGTVMVIAAAAHPGTRLGRAMGWAPLVWLGVRSYGVYLWHEPIIVLTTPADSHGVDLPRAAAQIAASILLAALSWRYVEEPIRHGALGRMWTQARSARWRPQAMSRGLRLALAGTTTALILTVIALAGANPRIAGPGSGLAATQSADLSALPSASTAARGAGRAADGRTLASSRTACRAVVHIGDSTSAGLVSSDYLPDPGQRLEAQYARVGVAEQRFEITPATSIVETLPGGTDAAAVAQRLVRSGYRGCWVLALGTNDAADVAVGSSVSFAARIQRMMQVIGHEPVLWVNVKSLVSSGPYAEANMQRWNAALVTACSDYPRMRVFDWASVAEDRWFIPDGIHYYSPGYAARAHLIADALADAFPASGDPPSGCVVRTAPISVPVRGVSG